jgi:iron complex transport system permease protein
MKRAPLVCALALALLAAASLGPAGLRAPWDLHDVIGELRAARVLLAALVGASLAVAGVGMQALFRNDLADPFVLGISGGASAGAVVSLALWPALPLGPAAAAGAAGAAAAVRYLAGESADGARLLLCGVALGSILSSATGLVLVLAPTAQAVRSALHWLFGGLGSPRFAALLLPAIALALALALLRARAESLDRLSLGDDIAASLGVPVRALRRLVLLSCVALTAVAVAAGGLVGFVGLVAPHGARRFFGEGHRDLLPAAALGGALLVVLADLAARSLFAPREVPVGLVTAAVGGPLFLWQLRREAR